MMKPPNLPILNQARSRLARELDANTLTWSESNEPSLPAQAQALWGVVRKYTGHPLFLSFLASLIEAYDVPARNPEAYAKAVADYSIRFIKFFREYPERFQSPMRTVVWGIGDCDDKAIFVGAALRSVRIPVQLSFLRLRHPELVLSHVYPRAFIGGKWLALETVRRYPWGRDPADIARSKNLLLSAEAVGDKQPLVQSYA